MDPLRITPEQIATRVGAGEDLVFVDARSEKAWGKATDKLPGAVRISPDGAAEHLADLPVGKPIVAYCT